MSPDFKNAPLVEVALSVQFQPLAGFAGAHAGEFWQEVKADFPVAQDQPPLQPINEFFGGSRPAPAFMDIGLSFGYTGTRTFFLTADGDFLIQIQNNRFAVNWRKTAAKPEYPRYEAVKAKFDKYFEMFRKFVAKSGIGSGIVKTDLFEAHYVNQWLLEKGKSYDAAIGDWVKLLNNQITSLEMEQASISTQYLIKGISDQPVGRLYLNVSPIINVSGQFGINLELICRTLPFEDGAKAEFAPLDLAREKIVTTFKQITSDSAHQFWRGPA